MLGGKGYSQQRSVLTLPQIRRVARQDKIQLLRDALMRTYGDADMTWDRITIFDQGESCILHLATYLSSGLSLPLKMDHPLRTCTAHPVPCSTQLFPLARPHPLTPPESPCFPLHGYTDTQLSSQCKNAKRSENKARQTRLCRKRVAPRLPV